MRVSRNTALAFGSVRNTVLLKPVEDSVEKEGCNGSRGIYILLQLGSATLTRGVRLSNRGVVTRNAGRRRSKKGRQEQGTAVPAAVGSEQWAS
jgi:hypothetical protein